MIRGGSPEAWELNPTNDGAREHGQLRRLLVVVVVILLSSVAGEATAGGGADRLKGVISLRFPGTEWVTREDLSAWMLEEPESNPILLDSRTEEEFAVSHIRGAVRVDPDVEAASLSHLARDNRIVVYCSVGYRSAAVARRLSRAGFSAVRNLQGGIFGWANQGLTVYRGDDPTNRVHPYNDVWGRFLDETFHTDE